jgi:uncharacterized protein (DUF2344 family)
LKKNEYSYFIKFGKQQFNLREREKKIKKKISDENYLLDSNKSSVKSNFS